MSRITETLGFSVPPSVVKQVATMAKQEGRTKSELVREMVRVYRRYRAQRDRDDERWISNLIEEANAEQTASPMSIEQMLQESQRLARYGQKQAKRLGIKAKDVSRIIHE